MTTPQPASSTSRPADRSRRMIVLLALLLVAAASCYAYVLYASRHAPDYRFEDIRTFLAKAAQDQKLASSYVDADGDLVADAPSNSDKFQKVDELGFCLIAGDDPQKTQEEWRDFIQALEKATGKKVSYRDDLETLEAQLAALRDGTLHVTAFSTGEVPIAVNTAGFVPLASPADAEGKYSYEMEILVPAASSSRSPADLRGKTVAFTAMSSNSGARAPLLILKDEFHLLPGRDYQHFVTGSHQRSIELLAAGKYDAVCVANDMLASAVAAGDIRADQYRSIYKSGSFPPLCLGVAHDLPMELISQVKKVLEDFRFEGTSLEKRFGPQGKVRFAPVNYKRDWAQVREINDSLARLVVSR
jgi:phosphonate transport system substrate-binding protein